MIDYIYLPVSDLNRSSEFYKKMLEPLGIDMPYKFDQLLGFAINSDPGFWLKNGEVAKDLYVAFTAKSADAVRASYKAAIDAGATSNKEPSLRPEWRADYFAANIGTAFETSEDHFEKKDDMNFHDVAMKITDMRRALAPILFDDHDRASAQAQRKSVVAPAQRSKAARKKATDK